MTTIENEAHGERSLMSGNIIHPDGHVMKFEERQKYWRKKGLCEKCGITAVSKKNIIGLQKALHITGKVYKGHCLRCYVVVQNSLGNFVIKLKHPGHPCNLRGSTGRRRLYRSRHESTITSSVSSDGSNLSTSLTYSNPEDPHDTRREKNRVPSITERRKGDQQKGLTKPILNKSLIDHHEQKSTMGCIDKTSPKNPSTLSSGKEDVSKYKNDPKTESNSFPKRAAPSLLIETQLSELMIIDDTYDDQSRVSVVAMDCSRICDGSENSSTSFYLSLTESVPRYDNDDSYSLICNGSVPSSRSLSSKYVSDVAADHSRIRIDSEPLSKSVYNDQDIIATDSSADELIESLFETQKKLNVPPSKGNVNSADRAVSAVSDLNITTEKKEKSPYLDMLEVTMKNCENDIALQQEALQKILNLPYDMNQLLTHHVKGLVCAITSVSKRHSTYVNAWAFLALWRLSAICDQTQLEVSKSDVTTFAIKMITNSHVDKKAALWACGLLSNISTSSYDHIAIKEEDGIKQLIQILKQTHVQAEMKKWVCRTLCNLSIIGGDTTKKYIHESDGVTALIDVMKQHKSEIDVLEWGCRLIWTLFPNESAGNISCETIHVILQIIKDHEHHYHIRHLSWGVLMRLLSQGGRGIMTNKNIEVEIVHVMRQLHTSASVQYQGLRALLKLSEIDQRKDKITTHSLSYLVDLAKEQFSDMHIVHSVCCIGINLCLNTSHSDLFLFSDVTRLLKNLFGSGLSQKELCPSLPRLIFTYFLWLHDFFVNGATIENEFFQITIDLVVDAANIFLENVEVIEVIFSLLSRLCVRCDEWKDLILSTKKVMSMEENGIIVSGMDYHSGSPAVQEKGCNLLANIFDPKHKNSFQYLHHEMNALQAAITNHSSDTLIQMQSFRAIGNLLQMTDEGSLLFGVIHEIIHRAMEDPYTEDIQHECCYVLLSFSSLGEAACAEIVSKGGMKVVIHAVQNHSSSEAIRHDAFGVLWNTSQFSKHIPEMIQNGGVEAIRNILNDPFLQTNIYLQQKAIAILRVWSKTSFNVHKEIISHVTIKYDFLNMLRVHQSSREILEEIFLTMECFFGEGVNQVSMPSEGVILIIEAMDNFKSEEILQGRACGVLSKLVSAHAHGGLVMVVEIMIKAMSQFPSSVLLQIHCITGLLNCACNDEMKHNIWNMNGTNMTIRAMKEFLFEPQVQELGCALLWTISTNETARLDIMKFDGIDIMIYGVLANLEHMNVSEFLGALQSFAHFSICRKKILVRGGLVTMMILIQVHATSEQIVIQCLNTLVAITVDNNTKEVSDVTDAIIDTIASVMDANTFSREVQDIALLNLKNFTHNVVNLCLMSINPDIKRQIQTAICKFPGVCGKKGNYVLASISGAARSSF